MGLFKNEDTFNHQMLQASQEAGVPLYVLKAFFALESQFDPKSYRAEPAHQDASYGIAQILFKTAQRLGYTGDPQGLFDPYTSALYGAKFLRQLHDQYPSIFDVIAAYNAGYPRKIQDTTQYIADLYKYPFSYKTNPPPGWVYANQCYVDRVAAYMAYYQAEEKNDRNTMALIAGILAQHSNWPAEFAKYTQARRYLRDVYWPDPVRSNGPLVNPLPALEPNMKTIERAGLIFISILAIYYAYKNIHSAVHGKAI